MKEKPSQWIVKETFVSQVHFQEWRFWRKQSVEQRFNGRIRREIQPMRTAALDSASRRVVQRQSKRNRDRHEWKYIHTGSTGGPANFGVNMLTNSGGIFVAKYNPDGISLWVTNSGGAGSWDSGMRITVGANGNLFVTGSYGGSGKFGSITLPRLRGPNIFTACYSADGTRFGRKVRAHILRGGNGNCPRSK